MALVGRTALQRWRLFRGESAFCSPPALHFQLQEQHFSNFLIQVLGQMSNLCLLVSKRNPLKESSVSLRDNTYRFFLQASLSSSTTLLKLLLLHAFSVGASFTWYETLQEKWLFRVPTQLPWCYFTQRHKQGGTSLWPEVCRGAVNRGVKLCSQAGLKVLMQEFRAKPLN